MQEKEQPQDAGHMIVLFGLKTCDSCRKARRWLEDRALAHRFVDLRADGLAEETLAGWIDAVGWERLLNRRSTSWRQLEAADRRDLDAERALALMMATPSLIKRPVFDVGGRILVGFDDASRQALAAAGKAA